MCYYVIVSVYECFLDFVVKIQSCDLISWLSMAAPCKLKWCLVGSSLCFFSNLYRFVKLFLQLLRYCIIVFWVAESDIFGLFGFDEFFIVVVAAVRNSDIWSLLTDCVWFFDRIDLLYQMISICSIEFVDFAFWRLRADCFELDCFCVELTTVNCCRFEHIHRDVMLCFWLSSLMS